MIYKFDGKKFLELIYVKAQNDKTTKANIRAEIMERLKVSNASLSLWAQGQAPNYNRLFELKEYFRLDSIEEFFIESN